MNPHDEVMAAGRSLQKVLIADVPEIVKHHVHEALHHMTVAALALDEDGQHATQPLL